MDIKPISDKLSLSEQLQLSDITTVAEQGYRSIICNRPDGEGADQPTFDEVKAVAEPLGLDIRYLPVVPGQISDDDVEAFSQTMRGRLPLRSHGGKSRHQAPGADVFSGQRD